MCGEHRVRDVSACRREGSSPHVRGAQTHLRRVRLRLGIIPACAGSTYKHRGSITPNPGSSPHVRGALVSGWVSCFHGGIIPACAGSTIVAVPFYLPSRDHPRMCGEHTPSNRPADFPAGSSPHVRGARGSSAAPKVSSGIIPACAGSTLRK